MESADCAGPQDPGQALIAERFTRLDERSMGAGERTETPAGSSPRWIAVAVAVAVLMAALLGLLGRVVLDGTGGASPLARPFLRDLLAALSWVPVGAGVVWLVRRFPPRKERPVLPAVIHLSGIAVASFSVNLLIATTWWVTGLWPEPRGFPEMVLSGTVRHVHANALIYLLLLAMAVRARSTAMRRDRSGTTGSDDVAGRRLAVSHGDRTLLVPLSRVDWIEAAGDYASVHTGDRSYLLAERMHALEARLQQQGFARVQWIGVSNALLGAEAR